LGIVSFVSSFTFDIVLSTVFDWLHVPSQQHWTSLFSSCFNLSLQPSILD
jgi:hypothetical protein